MTTTRFQQAINRLKSTSAQEHTSKNTCINTIPSLFKKVRWQPGTCNLDYGGGKYETTTLFLAMQGVKNKVYDPYNRTEEHNNRILEYIILNRARTATISNVLNVIKEKECRKYIIRKCYYNIELDGFLYIKVYEGDKSGVGKTTKKGWQENRKLGTYIEEIKNSMHPNIPSWDYEIINNIIILFRKNNRYEALCSIV